MTPGQANEPVYPNDNTPTTPDAPPPVRPADPVDRPYAASYERERYVQPVQPVRPVPASRPAVWTTFRMIQVDYLVFGIIEAIVVIRFLLKLLGANPDAAFTSFMYQISSPFVAPFQGVFPSPATQGSVFELASLLAIIVYILISILIAQIIWVVRRRYA